MAQQKEVVILGGYGAFGRHIAADLAARTDVHLTIAGRRSETGIPFASSLKADFCQCDTNDSASLRHAVERAWLVINASGPFPAKNYSIPQACIDAGSHYIDIADPAAVAGVGQATLNQVLVLGAELVQQ